APDLADCYDAVEEASVADCLVRQLEDSDDEEDDLLGINDAGGPNAHVAAAWKDLQYTSFLCGTYHFVKEKRKAEGFLQRELARAEAELGEDYRDGGPRKRPTLEGDIEYYSVEKQITRRQNKKSPGFLSAVRIIWDATRAEMASTSEEPSAIGGIDQAAFVCLMVKVHYLVICPPVDRAVAQSNACKDWAKDNAGGGSTMSYERFLASIFELVDLWTQTLEAAEYDALAKMIANGITTEVERVFSLRSSSRAARVAASMIRPTVAKRMRSTENHFRLRTDESIVYDPNITKEPVYMEDLVEKVMALSYRTCVVLAHSRGGTQNGGLILEENSPRRCGWRRRVFGTPVASSSLDSFGAVSGWKKSAPKWPRRSHVGEDGETYTAVSNLARTSGAARIALLSPERVNAIIAKAR
ncbi:unnamed protein product, partial [Scytosiphon promiscuus]